MVLSWVPTVSVCKSPRLRRSLNINTTQLHDNAYDNRRKILLRVGLTMMCAIRFLKVRSLRPTSPSPRFGERVAVLRGGVRGGREPPPKSPSPPTPLPETGRGEQTPTSRRGTSVCRRVASRIPARSTHRRTRGARCGTSHSRRRPSWNSVRSGRGTSRGPRGTAPGRRSRRSRRSSRAGRGIRAPRSPTAPRDCTGSATAGPSISDRRNAASTLVARSFSFARIAAARSSNLRRQRRDL